MTKFAFFGTPYVARDTLARLVEAGYVPEVVVTSPDALRGRGMQLTPCETKAWALEHGIPVLTPSTLDDVFLQELQTYSCEYGIVVAYGKIIPQTILDAFPKGMLNVHYSLLPKYRGASPVEMALWNGEVITGVTVQKMIFQMDAGDIVAQEEMPILPDDTTLTLRPRLITQGADLLLKSIPSYLDGTAVLQSQDPALVTRAPKIRKEQGQLILSDDSEKNWNTYRALRESPGTYFFAEKAGAQMRVKITDAAYAKGVFSVLQIIPEGKSEQDFSYLSANGWTPLREALS